MACYFDTAQWERKNGLNGHLIADSLEELHALARHLGLHERAFQPQAVLPHYQLHINRQADARAAGAIHLEREAFTRKAGLIRDALWESQRACRRRSRDRRAPEKAASPQAELGF